MKTIFILILAFYTSITHAQQVSRTFIPVNPKAEKVKVLANEQSTFLIKTKADQSMEVIAFDDKLKELWGIGIVLKFPVLHTAEIYSDELALLMSDIRKRNFVLLEIDVATGHYSFSEYAISKAFQGELLARYHEHFWVKGRIGEEPVAFKLDIATQSLKTLPVGHANPVNEISHFVYDQVYNELDILLKTNEKGYQAYLLRSINLKGEITRNLLLNHPDRHVTDLRFHKPESGNLEAIGTLAKKKPVLELGHFVEDPEGISMKTWALKEIPGLDHTVTLDADLPSKPSKGLKTLEAEIDEVFFSEEGEIIVSLETFEKDFEVRGLLQRESDEQAMFDQIDQNRYGRRDFDTNETTLNDRVDNFSNTEEATYRFREVIIDRVQEQGNRHSQSAIIKINQLGIAGTYIKVPLKVNSNFSIPGQNLAAQSYWIADDEGLKRLEFSAEPKLSKYDMSLGPYLRRINASEFLNYGFLLNEKVFYLMLQRIGFEESSN